MTIRAFQWGIRSSTFISLFSLILVVYNIDPEKSELIGKILFYLSLFLFLSGIFILFLIWLRRKSGGEKVALVQVGMNFRQGILLALLAIVLLFLQNLKILVWWDGLLATAGIFLIELYFLSRRSDNI